MLTSGSNKWELKTMIDKIKKFFGITSNEVPFEAQEFQPDAIELEHHEPPVSMHFAWYIVIVICLFLIGWASLTEVDKIVTADGKVTTVRPPITMKPLDRSTIRKVNVRVGQKVKKGDVLFTFDQTVNMQELKRLNEQLRSYQAEKVRLQAEAIGYKVPPKFGKPMNPDEVRQQELFDSRKEYYMRKLASYDETITRYKKTLATLEDTIKHYKGRQKILETIFKMYEGLHERKTVSLKELLAAQVEVLGTSIQLDNQNISIIENRQSILATQAEKDAFISDWDRQIAEKIVENERNITAYLREIPKYEMYVSMTELRAPCDSVVHELAPFQEGSAVREAEALVTLIPIDSEVRLAEIDIPARDISWIRVGDKSRLKLDAFPFQQCGTLDGEIVYISQDAFQRNGAMQEPVRNDDGGIQSEASRGVSYQARLKITGKLKGRAEGAELLPGMRLRAEIKVGKRRVISYIFNPFLKALDEAIREP
jgi:HlyD family secretion protein